MKSKQHSEVLIIGAGAAGSIYAALLAEAGKQVTVIERGPERKLSALYSSLAWGRRLKWGIDCDMEGRDPLFLSINGGHGTGGTALHHWGLWPRLHPQDFSTKSLFGKGRDWPINYDDLRPYYDKVQDEVGLSGDHRQEPWRPEGKAYPQRAVPMFRQGQLLKQGFTKMGLETSPAPFCILTEDKGDRKACIWDGWCDAGCPIGALANPLVTYIPRAQKAGAQILTDKQVTRVLTNKRGDKATGAEYYDADGKQHRITADTVVVAANTMDTIRLLQASANDQHPEGLANRSGLLGKSIMGHPSVSIFGMFDEDVQTPFGLPAGQLYRQHGIPKDSHKDGAYGSRQWVIGLAMKPNDLFGVAMTRPDILGPDLHPWLQKASSNLAAMISACEDVPMDSNYASLSKRKDRFGMPLTRYNYQRSPESETLLNQSITEGKAVMEAAGAKEAWNSSFVSQHIMGGTTMGTTAENSIANGWGQTHEIDNLYIGGASLFPTSSNMNPTFTIHALAMRSVEYLLKQ